MASSDKAFRAAYKTVHDNIREALSTVIPMVEGHEATIAQLLRTVPPEFENLPVMTTIKRDLFKMKDGLRHTKKALRTLNRKIKITGSPIIGKGADAKFLKKLAMKHVLILRDIRKKALSLDATTKELKQVVERLQAGIRA